MSHMTATQKLFGTTTLDEHQAAMAKKTYALLSIAATAAILGVYFCVMHLAVIKFLVTGPGLLTGLVLINAIPYVAMWASRRSPSLALCVLALDGYVSGIVITPALLLAGSQSPRILLTALGATISVFLAITGYVMISRRRFSASAGLITGLFVSTSVALFLNALIGIGSFGVLISIGVGVMGAAILVHATSDVLNNPNYDNPIRGALMLFAGLFDIFVFFLSLLLHIFSSRD